VEYPTKAGERQLPQPIQRDLANAGFMSEAMCVEMIIFLFSAVAVGAALLLGGTAPRETRTPLHIPVADIQEGEMHLAEVVILSSTVGLVATVFAMAVSG